MRAILLLFASCAFAFGQGLSLNDQNLLYSSKSFYQGLKGHWTLDEASGNRLDSSGHSNTLWPKNTPGQAAGKIGSSATFLAASFNYLIETNTTTLGFGNESFTVAFWTFLTVTNVSNTLVSQQTNGQSRFVIFHDTTPLPKFRLFSSGTTTLLTHQLTAATFPLNQWVYLVCWYDAAAATAGMSYNGTKAKVMATGGTINTNLIRFTVGDDGGAGTSTCRIDELAYWNRALSDTEISVLYGFYSGTSFPVLRQKGYATNWFRLADLPAPTWQPGLESLNGLVYVVGGYGSQLWTNNFYAYNPTNDTWTAKAAWPYKAESPVIRAIGNNLYTAGGYSNHVCFNFTYMYEPTNDTWTAKSAMPIGLEDMPSAVISNKLYICGGLSTNNVTTHTISPFIQVYDPSIDTWTTNYTAMPNPRCLGDFGATDGTNFFVFSGTADMSSYGTGLLLQTPRCDKYDVGANSWSTLAAIPWGSCYKDLECVNHKIYSMGSTWITTTNYMPFVQVYDIATDSWSFGPDAPWSGNGMSMAQINGVIYLLGGAQNANTTYSANFYSFRP